MHRGTFAKLADRISPDVPNPNVPDAPELLPFVAEHEGYNLHAGVHIGAGDDLGRERLLRYGARPLLALDRLRRLRDGRIAYRTKYARTRSKHRVMTPLELLARLAALISPPRFPLIRFHGVLGPRSSSRTDVVPKPRSAKVGNACERNGQDGRRESRSPEPMLDARNIAHTRQGPEDTGTAWRRANSMRPLAEFHGRSFSVEPSTSTSTTVPSATADCA
jgi:hypothetical protein